MAFGTVARVFDWPRWGGAARRRRTGSSTGVCGAILRGRCSVMWPPPSQVKIAARRSGRGGRGATGLGFGQTGQAPAVRQVMPGHGAGQPGHIGRKEPAGRWRAAYRSHRRRFDDRVVAVRLGLDRLERRIGEGGVVTPDGNSSACRAATCLFRSRPAGLSADSDRLALHGERRVRHLGGLM